MVRGGDVPLPRREEPEAPAPGVADLQEQAARRLGAVPSYSITEEGPDHYKTFHATAVVDDLQFGPVSGTSKKEAEQGAARVALNQLGWAGEGESEERDL